MKRRVLAILSLVFVASACTLQEHRGYVRDGLLMRGLHRDAFLEEWGLPLRTSTVTGEDAIQAGWGPGGGSFFKGKAAYDVWEYEDPPVKLAFYRAKLVSWQTTQTVEQLRAKGSVPASTHGRRQPGD